MKAVAVKNPVVDVAKPICECKTGDLTRGLCRRCYSVLRSAIRRGAITEEIAVEKGLIQPKVRKQFRTGRISQSQLDYAMRLSAACEEYAAGRV